MANPMATDQNNLRKSEWALDESLVLWSTLKNDPNIVFGIL